MTEMKPAQENAQAPAGEPVYAVAYPPAMYARDICATARFPPRRADAMPRIYRVMQEEEGRPRVGRGATMLGVRLPDGPGRPDIVPDADRFVLPATGGMSVSPGVLALLERLPAHMIPRRLRGLARDPGLPPELRAHIEVARGKDRLRIWRFGEGEFTAGSITEHLVLRPDPQDAGHGFVEPSQRLRVEEYLKALEATRDSWSVAEWPSGSSPKREAA